MPGFPRLRPRFTRVNPKLLVINYSCDCCTGREGGDNGGRNGYIFSFVFLKSQANSLSFGGTA
ncbi:unnamed protein product [Ectocarpus sp. CCAP 1310/34]|nr:unnamed protein product [Ectocarpus sp. CCAP 1310/34]